MKQLILTSILIFNLLSCSAQNITPIFGNDLPENNPNNYFKDVFNDFNKFEGAWKIQNSVMEFKIVLEKKIAVNDNNGEYIYDILVGEYFYSENNVEIVNTLDDIDDSSISAYGHKIKGYAILHKYNRPECTDCDSIERRVKLLINNPTNENGAAWLTLRYINDNGVEKLEATIEDNSMMGDSPRAKVDIPSGDYVLTKE